MTIFGGGRDLIIFDDCNINSQNYSDLGHSYEAPNGLIYGSE